LGLSREELAQKAGVGLRFLRELEQGKETLKMNKVNQVLILFGMQLGVVPMNRNNLIER
jgi:predicted transcriptional regulator